MKQLLKSLTFLLLVIANVQYSFAGDVWDGKTIATGFRSGTGTKSNPYTIYTGSEFAYFYTQMANNDRTFAGQYIKLMNDIDMGDGYLNTLTNNYNYSFEGDFDGADHSLGVSCGIRDSDPKSRPHLYGQYLFEKLYGTVHNINFVNYPSLVATVYQGGEVYNCHFSIPCHNTIYLKDGTLANCTSGSDYWHNPYSGGGSGGGLCNGTSTQDILCKNCDFDGVVYQGYGNSGGFAYNYGYSSATSEYCGKLTDDEHNQWVAANSTSSKTYKTWPLTFNPSFPSYNVTVSFVDNSGLTSYTSKTMAAGTAYTLPVPSGFESEFLGWECNGEIVSSITPTDNIVCIAKWNHEIKQQPTLLNPVVTVADNSYATYQWNKTALPTKHFENPQSVTTFTTSVDNMVLTFDYSVAQYYSGGRYGYNHAGYVSINGERLIYVATDDNHTYTGTMRFVCTTAGTYTITKDGATLTNMYLECPSTTLSGIKTKSLPYSFLTPNNGLYYCDIKYKNEVIKTDYIDTSTLFEKDGNIYYPTNETTVALLKVDTNAKIVTIPQAVTNDGVSYSVTAISDYAFADCVNLESIICMVPQPITIKTSAFASVPSSLIIYVPSAKVNTYKAASVWKNYTIRAKDSYPAKLYNGDNSALDVTVNLPNKPSEATTPNSLCFVDQNVRQTTEEGSIISNLVFKNVDYNLIAKDINLTDGKPFYSPANVTAETLTYTRTFGSTDWQALYIPFDMSHDEWADKAEVAEVMGVHTYDDVNNGTIDRSIIEFRRLKAGSKLCPNTPYVIKPNATGTVTFNCTGKTLAATPAGNGSVWCASTRQKYTLIGLYQETPITGNYALINGSFMKISSASPQHPFRFYLTIQDVNNGYGVGSPAQAPSKIRMMVDGEIVTGIDEVQGTAEDGAYYDLSGRRTTTPSRGIYIKNGKKTLIK